MADPYCVCKHCQISQSPSPLIISFANTVWAWKAFWLLGGNTPSVLFYTVYMYVCLSHVQVLCMDMHMHMYIEWLKVCKLV